MVGLGKGCIGKVGIGVNVRQLGRERNTGEGHRGRDDFEAKFRTTNHWDGSNVWCFYLL